MPVYWSEPVQHAFSMNFHIRKPFKRLIIAAFLILLLTQLTSGCFQFRMSESEVYEYFKDTGQQPSLKSYKIDGRTIYFADIGKETSQMVIFFHGAPGSWSSFIAFMSDKELLENFRLISVDRPGYGYSDFGKAEPSLLRQAELIKPVLELNRSDKLPILVGHSLGGPVIAKIAMQFPELVGGVIMVAASIDPELEPSEYWRGPLRMSLLNWMVPRSLRVTNDEIYFLKQELKHMLLYWKDIRIPVTVIQGGNDSLVNPMNAVFAERMLVNAKVDIRYYEKFNHFIPWNNPQLIKEAILDMGSVKSVYNDITSN